LSERLKVSMTKTMTVGNNVQNTPYTKLVSWPVSRKTGVTRYQNVEPFRVLLQKDMMEVASDNRSSETFASRLHTARSLDYCQHTNTQFLQARPPSYSSTNSNTAMKGEQIF